MNHTGQFISPVLEVTSNSRCCFCCITVFSKTAPPKRWRCASRCSTFWLEAWYLVATGADDRLVVTIVTRCLALYPPWDSFSPAALGGLLLGIIGTDEWCTDEASSCLVNLGSSNYKCDCSVVPLHWMLLLKASWFYACKAHVYCVDVGSNASLFGSFYWVCMFCVFLCSTDCRIVCLFCLISDKSFCMRLLSFWSFFVLCSQIIALGLKNARDNWKRQPTWLSFCYYWFKHLCLFFFLSFQAEAEEKAVSTKEVLMKWRVDLGEEGAGKCTDHRVGRKGNRKLQPFQVLYLHLLSFSFFTFWLHKDILGKMLRHTCEWNIWSSRVNPAIVFLETQEQLQEYLSKVFVWQIPGRRELLKENMNSGH